MAIRSSLAIQREVMRFNEKLGTKKGFPPLLVRIGINTGPVIVRALSSDLRVQLVAVGNTLDMATTMQHLAKPGSIYVTEETFRPAQSIFRFESVDEQRAKGKKKPVKIYRVVGPDTSRTGSDPSAERGLTRFVGRQEELQLLLRCLEEAKAGRGQTVSITAEAGVGKSRLLYEFRKAVANENILFLEGRCLSYGRADPYHPIVDMLKSNFEIRDEDRDPEITEKVKKGLAILGQDNTATLPYLLELLSVKNSGIDNFSMSSAAKTDRILSSILRLALKRSEERPLLLVFEDLHWIDKSSEESAKYLVENISAARILIILTYRPDFVQTWGSRSFHSHMELNRLSNKETTTMVSNILGCDDVSMDLANALLEKTKGIPFFIEEFVRALKDMDIIKRNLSYNLSRDIDSVAIPCTIQEVIMARVDSLPDAAKEVLQAGSVVGREFSTKLIGAVTELPELGLLSHLSALMYAELIYERGVFPESTYIFKHAITREVIYDSILSNRKKVLHQKVGKAIEELYQDNLDSYFSILADHFMLGEDFQKSADYSKLAYERARIQAAFPSALSYAEKRIAALEGVDPAPGVQLQLIDARTFLGLTLFVAGDLAMAHEAIAPIIAMALKTEDKRCLAQIDLILGSYHYSVEEDFPSAFECLRRAIQTIEEISDLTLAAPAHLSYGLALCWNCQFEMGAESIRKALRIGEAAHILWGVSVLNSNLSHYAYNYQGKVEEGFETSLKAVETAEISGDIYSRAVAQVFHGVSCFYKGYFTLSIEHLLKGIDLCERIQSNTFLAIAHQALGYVYFETGDYKKSQKHHQQCIMIREHSGLVPLYQPE